MHLADVKMTENITDLDAANQLEGVIIARETAKRNITRWQSNRATEQTL